MTLHDIDLQIWDWCKRFAVSGMVCDTMILHPYNYNELLNEFANLYPVSAMTMEKEQTFKYKGCTIYRSTDQKQGTVTLLRS